jgi:membrane-associated protein
METIQPFLDVVLHLDKHLNQWADFFGAGLYVVLFLIVFCETGLVVTPFLPGDSLLFAVGALAASSGSNLSLPALIVLLIAAAVLGDAVNYAAGYWVGPRVFKSERSWLFNRKHLLRTQEFYDRHGGKTIILARFIPIIRTFAPFVAGIGKMRYPRFALYNVTGGVVWVLTFLLGGYFLGEFQVVKDNFPIVIFAIIGVSVLPVVVEYTLSFFRKPAAGSPSAADEVPRAEKNVTRVAG